MSSEYGQVEQRRLVVHSAKLEAEERKQLCQRVNKAQKAATSSLNKLRQTTFNCEADAMQAIAALNKKLKWHTIQAQYKCIKKYARRGRPAKGATPVTVEWKVQDSLFLKSPARIMAMMMIMGLSLLIYALAEREVRRQLKARDETIHDQKGKPTQSPTMRRIAQMFEGIDMLEIRLAGRLIERRIINLSQLHLKIIRLFGTDVEKYYLIKI